jgi:leucyl aminopeptidase
LALLGNLTGVVWVHLDIADSVWALKPAAMWDKGATGYGVGLLDRLIAENFEGLGRCVALHRL